MTPVVSVKSARLYQLVYSFSCSSLSFFAAAASYYQKAADQGNAAGMSGIGVMLRFGRGVKKDAAAAAR